jgi:hypothetical protein
VWYFSQREFKELIQSIGDETYTVESLFQGMDLRELPSLSKFLRKMTLSQLTADPRLIEQLYKELRAGMPPPTRFKLPYKKADRELELMQTLAENYDIDITRAKAKVVTGCYEGDGVVFPYAIEAVIAPRKNWRFVYKPGSLEFIGYVNDSPSIDGGEKYFAGDPGTYTWKNKKTGNLEYAATAREILQGCGFDTYAYYNSKKRVPSVFLINLKTNVRQWMGGAGKTQINLAPFAKDIAQLVSWLAYQIPTCHGMGLSLVSYSGRGRDPSQVAKKYLKDFLIKRRAAVDQNPSLRITDRLTHSGVWYRIRPIMKEKGFEPPESWGQTRTTLTGDISDVIEELWPGQHLTREDLGIVAGSRGAVFYDGEAWPINGDTIDALAEKGIAIIIIEKEGVADVLAPYARKYGIALAHTGGRFTNAIKKMIERAKEGGSVVRILTDYDAVGMDIGAATITPTIRVGIERDIIKWLQENDFPDLTEEDVEEEYTPSGTTIEIKDEYLKTHRIELDSIQQEVGAGKLWEYIVYRLQLPEFNTGFDLTKVIERPTTESLRPQEVKDALALIDSYLAKVIEKREAKILQKLENVKELVEIPQKQKEIEEELSNKIAKAAQYDKGVMTIISKFQGLLVNCDLPKPEECQSDGEDDDNGKDEGVNDFGPDQRP